MSRRSRILIVDDEPINVRILEKALQEKYDISTAYNGDDAIRKMREQQMDLVLLDIMMPGMNGFEVCKAIRDDDSFLDIPVIFVTAMDTKEGEIRGLELGGIDYIAKPVNLVLLRLRVCNHIEMKERNDLVKEQRDVLARQKQELESAFARIKILEGIITVCMYCKNIRTNIDSWQQMEEYISDHSDAIFSHGICPKCFVEQETKLAEMLKR